MAQAEGPIGDPSTPEVAPSTDDAVDEEPAEPAAGATAEPATEGAGEARDEGEEASSEEDISLEAILEDLKRREGRSG